MTDSKLPLYVLPLRSKTLQKFDIFVVRNMLYGMFFIHQFAQEQRNQKQLCLQANHEKCLGNYNCLDL